MWSFNEFKMALVVAVRENRGILRCLNKSHPYYWLASNLFKST